MLSIKFTDGEIIKEPNLDWASIPTNKTIQYMEYTLGKQTIRLLGYSKYLRLKELMEGVNVNLNGISKLIFAGQKGILCDKITIDLVNRKVTKTEVEIEKIYNDKPIADTLWKFGQILENPNVYIRNN